MSIPINHKPYQSHPELVDLPIYTLSPWTLFGVPVGHHKIV